MRPNMKVLDLGCGTGFPALELAERLGASCHVIGLDPWPNALQRAHQKNLVYGASNVDFVLADAGSMPFGAKSFDLVVSNLGLNNWADPSKVLAECSRTLKPNGTLALTTNPQGHWKEFYAAVRRILERLGDQEAALRLDHQGSHRLSHEKAEPFFKKASLIPIRRAQETLVFRYNDTSAFLSHHFVGWGFKAGWKEALGLELWNNLVPALEKELDRTSRDRGAIRLTVPVEYWEFEKQ